MIPVLFEKTATSFNTNGMGRLSDAISCIATEERNGIFELATEYPEGGMHADELETDRIIYAKPAAFMTEQPFRIYKISKPLSGKFKIMARHISYDLAYVSVMPFVDQGSAANAIRAMFNNAENIGNFSYGSVTVSTSGTFKAEAPASFRNMMGGKEGSILDVFGGEILWDGFAVSLLANRGTDRGLTLRYGKNISDISQDKDIDYTVTGITPFYKTANDETLTLPEKTVYKAGAGYSTPTRTRVLDCASYIDENAIREAHPTETETQIKARLVSAMRAAAQAYANANLSGVPDATISVSFVDLGSTEEYKDQKALFTQAGLCDTVKVFYERLGIETTAKIIKTEYNVLLERFEKLTIGKPKSNLTGSLKSIQDSINKTAADASSKISAVKMADSQELDKSIAETRQWVDDNIEQASEQADRNIAAALQTAEDYADQKAAVVSREAAQGISDATAALTAQMKSSIGGYVTLNRDANGNIYEILITDHPNYMSATKVWKWNQNGLAYSATGYRGTYTTGIGADGTINGRILASESIYAGAIKAGEIKTGHIDAGAITAEKLDANAITAGIIVGKIQDSQIQGLSSSKLSGDITGNQIASLPTNKLTGSVQNSQIAGLDATKLTNKINTGSIGWINLSDGTFSLAGGKFKYINGSYIELFNNLSLRLNSIPLAGNYKYYDPGDRGGTTWYQDVQAWGHYTSVGKNAYVTTVVMPYMVILEGAIRLEANKKLNSGMLVSGIPDIAPRINARYHFEAIRHTGNSEQPSKKISLQGDSGYNSTDIYLDEDYASTNHSAAYEYSFFYVYPRST